MKYSQYRNPQPQLHNHICQQALTQYFPACPVYCIASLYGLVLKKPSRSNLQFKWKKPKSHHTSWAFHILKTPNFEWSRKQNKEKLETAANQEILSFEIWYRNIISFYISVRWALSQVLKKQSKSKYQLKWKKPTSHQFLGFLHFTNQTLNEAENKIRRNWNCYKSSDLIIRYLV